MADLVTDPRSSERRAVQVLVATVLADLAEHACETYPLECCGFVRADGTVHRARNIQDDLAHAQAGRYARGAAEGFTLSLEDTLALHQSFETATPAVVLYHSHPDVGAYFSAEDRDKALFDGQPVLPVQHLVLDAQADGVRGAKLFGWNGADFACTASFVFSAPAAPSPLSEQVNGTL